MLYAVLGGALALALCFGLDFAGYVGAPGIWRASARCLLLPALPAGLVYWLFAGRRAGLWK